MARVTKRTVIDEYFKVFEEYSELSTQLLDRAGKDIKYGAYLIYGLSYNYHSNWYLEGRTHGWKKEETKLWDFQYHLKEMKHDMEKVKAILADPKRVGWAKE